MKELIYNITILNKDSSQASCLKIKLRHYLINEIRGWLYVALFYLFVFVPLQRRVYKWKCKDIVRFMEKTREKW